MKRYLLLAAALFLSLETTAQDHRALITEIQGTVTIQRANGTSSAASWGTQLFDGDVVRTGPGSKAAVLYANGNMLSVAAASEAAIGDPAGSPSVDPSMLADVSDLTLRRTGAGEIAALGGLRSGGSDSVIDLTFPRHTAVMAGRPTFSWQSSGMFDLYKVTVLSEEGTVWSGETSETSLTYPDDAPALVPGAKYFWRVEGEELLDVTRSGLVAFEIMDADRAGTLAEAEANLKASVPAGPAQDFLLGSFYAKQGMNAQAVAVFERIAETEGDSAMVYEILGKLYYEIDRKDDAVAALERALELSR